MMNLTTLVGRLTSDPEVKTTENGKSYANITIAVPRSYKNENGEYDTDFVKCKLWGGIAEKITEYCHKGDLIGLKGRLETRQYEDDNGKHYLQEVVAEKVSFLSSKVKEKETNNEMEV